MGEPAHAEDAPPPAASLATITIGGKARRGAGRRQGRLCAGRQAGARRSAIGRTGREHRGGDRLVAAPADRRASTLAGRAQAARLAEHRALQLRGYRCAPQAIRLGGAMPTPSSITLTPALGIWLIDAARLALRSADMCRESAWFGDTGAIEAILLPLSLHGKPDHVLYHLRRLT